jgi:hypothetical protein
MNLFRKEEINNIIFKDFAEEMSQRGPNFNNLLNLEL